jgi:hypothetical protein
MQNEWSFVSGLLYVLTVWCLEREAFYLMVFKLLHECGEGTKLEEMFKSGLEKNVFYNT